MADETPAGFGLGAPTAKDQFGGLTPSINVNDEDGMDALEFQMLQNMKAQARGLRGELPDEDDGSDPMARPGGRITDRETDYQKQCLKRTMTPARVDAYSMGDKTPDASTSSYADIMRRNQLAREADNTVQNILYKQKEAAQAAGQAAAAATIILKPAEPAAASRRRNRWGEAPENASKAGYARGEDTPSYGLNEATPGHNRWDATPSRDAGYDATPSRAGLGDATPGRDTGEPTPAGNRWDATPTPGRSFGETPKRNRWDMTPVVGGMGSETPSVEATPGRKRSRYAVQKLI